MGHGLHHVRKGEGLGARHGRSREGRHIDDECLRIKALKLRHLSASTPALQATRFCPNEEAESFSQKRWSCVMARCVLIVDDEPAVRALASDILSDAGFDTIAAADAGQALHVLTHDVSTVDVLFTDV